MFFTVLELHNSFSPRSPTLSTHPSSHDGVKGIEATVAQGTEVHQVVVGQLAQRLRNCEIIL